ncbi:deoxyuridine 5'-triphosphate nucleotidohydrolase Dut [Desulfitobacterium dichloroeliminans LMG P-21439]|uniref:Deoxyuridine 5'-triphosphate nucleotidohydrolase n=1 Tax=Desulfitobacterium dichloroeliminans (strain LMG P-21439 / DCA1) TaxID=871963 RepID=L0FBF5_DESDL|nr:dUTP diphosphatase [Desulfitobacterium dichloroeliminans]AGA69986.1 deoxyuridine 5'-triphosphate nucleotidohydrolase Dut [Desulfitobacterium dichloroeliminans LMG P-21439]
MSSITVKITSVRKNKPLNVPKYATPGAAGVDLRAALSEELVVEHGQIVTIPTGIAIELPHGGVGAFVFARSGLASKYGLALANGVGVIDSDYRGEIQVAVINQGKDSFKVKDGDRIAQMVFLPVFIGNFEVVEQLDESSRGSGGFGSTGVSG